MLRNSKNSCTGLALVLLLLVLQPGFRGSGLSAQLIGNSFDVHAGYRMGSFPGPDYVSEGHFIFPSFHSNLQQAGGFSAGITWWAGSILGVGLDMERIEGRNWQLGEEPIYLGSTVSLTSVHPSFLLHSPRKEWGLLNRIRFTAGISPVVGKSDTSLGLPIHTIVSETQETEAITQSSNVFYGVSGKLGADYSLTQGLAVYLEYSLGKNWGSSVLHSDQGFLLSGIEGGLILKLRKHKNFLH